jgi:hypothetical protein
MHPLLPSGSAYSTVSDITHAQNLALYAPEAASKELICHWLFNAKTITEQFFDTRSGRPVPPLDALETFHAFAYDKYAGSTPLPTGYYDPINDRYYNPTISFETNHTRWRETGLGNFSNNFFYVYVHEGVWYWTPAFVFGLATDGQVVTALNDTTYTVSRTYFPGDPSEYTQTKVVNITDTFY